MSGIRVENLTYRYGAKTALSDVSFQTHSGQFCALLGPNGAGKSTLFALLTHLFVPQTGRITINGTDIATHPRDALAQIGVVFQQSTLDMDLTVSQNLSYFAALQGLSGKAAQHRIDHVLDLLNITDRTHETIRALNGGHRRRVEIARSLIHDPHVLLLDEPTVGLDPKSRMPITRDVHALAMDHGKTVLWATHLTDEIMPTDHVLILHQGRICQDGFAQDLCVKQTLTQLFLSQTEVSV
jgi:ABC-2 type transport system ATP-binding protein